MAEEMFRQKGEEWENKLYQYDSFPENVRQIGESGVRPRVYIEDYVMTEMRRIFREEKEESIILFVGKEGDGVTSGALFIYGGIEVALDSETKTLQQEQWEQLLQELERYFPDGEIFGFGCGTWMWTSQVDRQIHTLQEEQLHEISRLVFLADLSESEEKLFYFGEDGFIELPGYYVYFARNPRMQEYMLRKQQDKEEIVSFEDDYEDEVTKSIRGCMNMKRMKQEKLQYIMFGLGMILMVFFAASVGVMCKNIAKIKHLEKTVKTMSDGMAVVEKQKNTTSEKQEDTRKKVSPSPTEKEPVATAATKVTAFPTQKVAIINRKKRKIKVSKSPKIQTTWKHKRKSVCYVVKKGDTLSHIVWAHYHSFSNMKQVVGINRIGDSDCIKEGQKIVLP